MAKKHGDHSGAWRVAYADFVTAMMALFLVLWLTAQDEKIKEAVQRSFTHPFSSLTRESIRIIPNQNKETMSRAKSGNFDSSSALELAMLRRLAGDLMRELRTDQEPEETRPVKLELTREGLRITVFDRSRKPIFKAQSAEFTQYGDWVLSTLAWQISTYASFAVEVEGHTEAGQRPSRVDYGDWEVSSDRATASRRKLIEHGVKTGQIRKVAGFGDTVPMAETNPEDEANRRITVLLKVRGAKGDAA
ncbi:MAG TPA: flagellar motor protein MotB [Verrucomicrobiae bacterium]|nr:flagellar motor protein MotB [Verrucomicrobiae bacterium]